MNLIMSVFSRFSRRERVHPDTDATKETLAWRQKDAKARLTLLQAEMEMYLHVDPGSLSQHKRP